MKYAVFAGPTLFFMAVSASLIAVWRSVEGDADNVTTKKKRPNFIIFFADDIGWGDLGANWKPNEKVTPQLNKMAAEGMRFTDFHVASSVCAPSRASLLTGRLGLRNGVYGNIRPGAIGGLPTNETTLAEVLLSSGYHTGMIGKWHLGNVPPYDPNSRGFEYYYGLPYSNDMGCLDVPVLSRPTCRLCLKNDSDPGGPGSKCRNHDTAMPLYENREIVEQPVDHIQLGDNYAKKADDFIAAATQSDKPFFLYVAFAHMHLPLVHAPRFTNSTDINTVYANTFYEMDDIIGRVMNSLKKYGVYDNTMAWFTGDNGPWQQRCPFSGDSGPFLGSWMNKTFGSFATGKGTNWEAGHRQPAVVIWPDRIPPNRTSDALTSAMDLFPTIVAAAGAKMPKWRRYDGMDLADVLDGKSDRAHEVLYHPNSGGVRRLGAIDTIRMGPYKLFWTTGGNQVNSRGCNGKRAPRLLHDPPLIFNVETDPAESEPLTIETDPAYNEIISSAGILRSDIMADIAADNTSRKDGSSSKDAYPCCDRSQYLCRCKKQPTVISHALAFLSGKDDVKLKSPLV